MRDRIQLDGPEERSFPLWVTFGSLMLALLLFFSGTVPALRERDDMGRSHERIAELREELQAHMDLLRASERPARVEDLQALLVAIDRLGFTPAELLWQIPEPPAEARVVDAR